MIKFRIAFSALFAFVTCAHAQIANFDEQAIEEDFVYNANRYSEAYIRHVRDGFGLNAISNWQYGAKPLSPYAFRIGVQGAATFTPDDQLKFNFNEVGFSDKLSLADPSDPLLPTALGGQTNKELLYEVEGQTFAGPVTYQARFPALSGASTPFNSTPGLGLVGAMGLPGDLEVGMRLFPNIRYYGANHFQIGGGLKHKVSRYFLKDESPLSISIAGYYTFSRFAYDISEFVEGENQQVVFQNQSVNADLSLSYQLGPVELSAIGGYYFNASFFGLNGTYSYEVEEGNLVQEAFSVQDPVSLTKQSGAFRSAFAMNVQFLKYAEFGVVYQLAEYKTLGVNLSFLINAGDED